VHPLQVAMYIHYHTARRAYEAGRFALDRKPDSPYPNTRSVNATSSSKASSKYSHPSNSTPPTTPPKPVMQQQIPNMEKSDELAGTSQSTMSVDRVDTNLIDLDVPFEAAETCNSIDVQLIDLLEPAVLEPAVGESDLLVDLEPPEDQSTIPNDIVALIDIFTGQTDPVKDQAFNVSASPLFRNQC
jgi:hypothetical protein